MVTANEISVTKYISKEWTALILLPTVRAIAGGLESSGMRWTILILSPVDCVTAINVSVKDQLTLSSAVAIGSTIVSGCLSSCVAGQRCLFLLRTATFALCYTAYLHRCVDNWLPVGDAL